MDKAGHISKSIRHVSEIRTTHPDGWKFKSEDPDRMDEVSRQSRRFWMFIGITVSPF
jgi:uncharacterized protein YqcC (DUF446 family)